MIAHRMKRCDLFGRDVQFYYRGENQFTTGWGSIVTFLVAVGYLIILFYKFIEFFGETDPVQYFSEAQQDFGLTIDLNSFEFYFAVEAIDPEIGEIEVH